MASKPFSPPRSCNVSSHTPPPPPPPPSLPLPPPPPPPRCRNSNLPAPPPPRCRNSNLPAITPSLDEVWGDQDGERAQKSLKRVFRILVGILVGVYCVLAALFSFWILLQPNSPEVGISSGSFTHFNLTGPELSSTWAIEISVHNPNKVSHFFNYEHIIGSVSYNKDNLLAEAQLRPFSQPGKNWTVIQAHFFTIAQFLDDDVRMMVEGDRSRGVIELDFTVMADVSFKSVFVRKTTRWDAMFCNRLKFEFDRGEKLSSANGTMVNAYPHKCRASKDRAKLFFVIWFLVFFLFLSLLAYLFL